MTSNSKKYMIVERFYPRQINALYQKFDQEGRGLPQGVTYLNSWIDESVRICFQLMEAESIDLIEEWISHWKEYAEFEIYPIISSEEAKQKVLDHP